MFWPWSFPAVIASVIQQDQLGQGVEPVPTAAKPFEIALGRRGAVAGFILNRIHFPQSLHSEIANAAPVGGIAAVGHAILQRNQIAVQAPLMSKQM